MLTERQKEVLEFLYESRNIAGLMPSTREIQVRFGFASQTAAVDVLRALERKGVLRRLPGVARGIILNEPALASSKVLYIPLRGVIAAGYANDSAELADEFLRVDAAATGLDSATGCFALRVDGESMTGAHILDGDYVILDSVRQPRHNDIVAALGVEEDQPAKEALHKIPDRLVGFVLIGLSRVFRYSESRAGGLGSARG